MPAGSKDLIQLYEAPHTSHRNFSCTASVPSRDRRATSVLVPYCKMDQPKVAGMDGLRC